MELPDRFRALIVGFPKTGKSGSLVPLLKAGYRVIYNDFDGNPEVLNLASGYHKNLVYLPFEDKYRMVGSGQSARLSGVSGEPKAFLRYMEFLETGRYITPDGKGKEDHGPITSWGPDTFCVTDSISSMVEAIWARYLFVMGRTSRRKQDWGTIVDELNGVCRISMALRLQCHSVMIAHFMSSGLEELEEDPKNERSELVAHNNERKKQLADLLGLHLFPRPVTKAQAERFAGMFPIVLPLTVNDNGKRIFDLQPRKEVPVALPAQQAIPKTIPQETGLLTIFQTVTGKGT